MADEFNKVVEVLDSEPSQQCVIRSDFLDELGIAVENLARAAGRPVHSALEFRAVPERNMTLRDKVFVFGPKESD